MDAIEEVPLIRQKIYSRLDDYFNWNHAIINDLVLNNITMRLHHTCIAPFQTCCTLHTQAFPRV